MKYKFFNYSGSKIKYIDEINYELNKFDSSIYIEPFVGSGSILFNLNKDFDMYVLNDISKDIITIYNAFKEIDYGYYLEKNKFIRNEFGDIRKEKESYYEFRDWFNVNHWNKATIDEGIYLHILANSCINSFLRFGPNGMNQSFGNRCYVMKEQEFNKVKMTLNKNVIIKNVPYKDVIEKYYTKDAVMFLDPPYFKRGSSYSNFSKDDLDIFLSIIKDKNYVYTDVYSENHKKLNMNYTKTIRNIRTAAPLSNKELLTNDIECIFTNRSN